MKIDFKEVLRPTVVLALVCLVITGLLGFTNSITKDAIEQNAIEAENTARQTVMPIADSFDKVDDTTYKALDKDGKVAGYVFITESKEGYGGIVKVMTGVDANRTVTGVSILSHAETVGLGANATKPEFYTQYNQDMKDISEFTVTKSEKKDGEIKALTGATISSRAVTGAVNEALSQFDKQ